MEICFGILGNLELNLGARPLDGGKLGAHRRWVGKFSAPIAPVSPISGLATGARTVTEWGRSGGGRGLGVLVFVGKFTCGA